MNESQKPLNLMLQGAILTIIGIIIIFITALSQVNTLTIMINMFLGLIFSGIGLGMLCQGYRLIKKIEMEVKE